MSLRVLWYKGCVLSGTVTSPIHGQDTYSTVYSLLLIKLPENSKPLSNKRTSPLKIMSAGLSINADFIPLHIKVILPLLCSISGLACSTPLITLYLQSASDICPPSKGNNNSKDCPKISRRIISQPEFLSVIRTKAPFFVSKTASMYSFSKTSHSPSLFAKTDTQRKSVQINTIFFFMTKPGYLFKQIFPLVYLLPS